MTPPPPQGEGTKWEASLAGTHGDTTIHPTDKERTAGERDLPEHNRRGHAKREVGTNGMKRSPQCWPRKRTTEKRLLVWAARWSLESYGDWFRSSDWERKRDGSGFQKQGVYTIFWRTLDQKGRKESEIQWRLERGIPSPCWFSYFISSDG